MILHYLGLDHIGHMGGPRSKLMPNKLSEMDNIIQRIVNYMVTIFINSYFNVQL
jgi:ethanolaminephosphotransferase